ETYKRQPARAYGVRTIPYGQVDDLPDQSDVTETAQGYWGSVPGPPQPRTKGTEARTSIPTPSTPSSTCTYDLPYRVITPA
ncbi:hypothetical protein BDN67DRAFT_1016510, partial [Paxillus ammoniavirescens]